MNMFITGGSGSGKSAFAESIAQKLGGNLVYIATMPVASPEDEKKVERHHKLRADKGFVTLEKPGSLTCLPDGKETLLIECISTHTANLMFSPENNISTVPSNTGYWIRTIEKELDPILRRKGNTIFVSAETAADGSVCSPGTEAYKTVLTAINRYLVQHSDAAFEMVCGIPVKIKGELPC